MPTVTPSQIRGARALLGWSMLDLAREAVVSVSTVKRIEMDGGKPVSDEVRETVRATLERAGVALTEADGWAGVRVRRE